VAKITRDSNLRDSLRSRAITQLKGRDAQVDASTALGVLYDLASSPTTAPDALALLHELQVHQVEVDIQEEELRRSRAELETSLNRQVQLYDYAPVGFFTLDFNAVVRELNQTGADMLGVGRDLLRGRVLENFLTTEAASMLRAMLGRVAKGAPTQFADLALQSTPAGETRCVHAAVCLDPAGGGCLVGLTGVSERTTPTGA
jgi:PAS domain-containing protein